MGREKFPYISFSASILAILALVALTVIEYVVYSEILSAQELDYLDHEVSRGAYVFMAYLAMFYPVAAVFGLATSWYCGANTAIIWVKRVSYMILGICIVVLFPFCAALLGWSDPIWVTMQIFQWFGNLFL